MKTGRACLQAAMLFFMVAYSGSVFSQTQYCAQRVGVSPTNACFDLHGDAEDFIKVEPSPEVGRKFLEPGPVTQLTLGNFSTKYEVKAREYEGFFGDWYNGLHISPGGASRRYCDFNPIPIGTGRHGCVDEAALAVDLLDGYPYYNCCPGQYVGAYGPWPPQQWSGLNNVPGTDRNYVHVSMNSSALLGEGRRRFMVTHGGGTQSENAIWRDDYYVCPSLFFGLSWTSSPSYPWPTVCWNNAYGYITKQSDQYDSCPKDGNPCVPGTGNKEYRETDFEWEGRSFTRAYNSIRDLPLRSAMGDNWAHSFSDRVMLRSNVTTDMYWLQSNGYFEAFSKISETKYRSRNKTGLVLYREGDEIALTHGRWRIVDGSGVVRWFGEAGEFTRMEVNGLAFLLSYCSASDYSLGSCESPGALQYVQSPSGRRLEFEYTRMPIPIGPSSGDVLIPALLTEIRQDGQPVAQYEYDDQGRLTASTVGDTTLGVGRQYLYAEDDYLCLDGLGNAIAGCGPGDFPYHLTGVLDESGARFATYTYDDFGRVTLSTHAGGAGEVKLLYAGGGAVEVSLPEGYKKVYQFDATVFHKPLSVERTVTDGSAAGIVASTYSDMRRTSQTDENGNRTNYSYNTFHETARVEGLASGGTPTASARTTQTDWSDEHAKPLERRTYDASNVLTAKSNWAYNSRGQILTSTQTDPVTLATRATTYTYCEAADVALPNSTCPILGLVKSIDGPRTDVSDTTTYIYRAFTDETGCDGTGLCHRKGDLRKITDALGHVTEILRRDRAGRVRASLDPNGVVTEFTYHPRGWLLTRTVKGALVSDDAVTTYTYDAVGQVTRITQPDGDFLDYDYDAAHRLIAIEDAAGNRIDYTLDAAGNRTAETTSDAATVVKRQLTRVYDQLGRIEEQLDAQARTTAFDHDANGNQTGIEDALNVETRQEYDPLNRLKKTIQDYTGLDVETNYAYDALDRLVTVTDPKGLDTDYTYDGLGNLTELDSPDTGITSYTYDAAGNRLTQTDARGITATHTYDALNRLTATTYPTTSLNLTYQYDQPNGTTGCAASFPNGRLTRMIDASGTTTYCYDRRGNLASKQWRVAVDLVFTTSYTYTHGDRLASVTDPNGITVQYTRDAVGRIVGISRPKPNLQPVVTAVDYLPFGPATAITFAGGATQSFTFDQNYWNEGVSGTALALDFDLDATGNIVAANDASPAIARSYTYDPLARLTDIENGSATLIEAYTYDGTGNRLSKQTAGGTQTYGYPPDSHRLTSIDAQTRSFDAMGSLTARGSDTLIYNDRQRLAGFGTGTTYRHNGRGERVRKTDSVSGTTYFHYDEAGHLIAESQTSALGSVPRYSYVWLDDRPVALYVHQGAPPAPPYSNQWLHIHTDHLGTPRAITRPAASNAIVWRWDFNGSAFGDHAPLTDPDGDATHFTFNLRFPGQYFDSESELNYNYFRDYESGTGRYAESDLIGLWGGISTYAYVGGKPSRLIDPMGLYGVQCGNGFTDVPLPSGAVLCKPDPGDNGEIRRCSTGALDCLLLGGPNPNTPFDTNLCEYDRLGNDICYKTCMSRKANDREDFHLKEVMRAAGRRVGFAGGLVDFGLTWWDRYENHRECMAECNIDLDRPCCK